jgi:hypothetical protein
MASFPLAIVTHLRVALQLQPELRLSYEEPLSAGILSAGSR